MKALRVNMVREKDSPWSTLHSFSLFHTDTYHTQSQCESNRICWGEVSCWGLTQKHSEQQRLCLTNIVFLIIISHRHLLHLTSMSIKSETQERNILVMPYEQTQWEWKNLLDLSSVLVSSVTQTLTTLKLNKNQIADKGAQYLGETLRTNTVRDKHYAWFLLYSCLLFHAETHWTQSRRE